MAANPTPNIGSGPIKGDGVPPDNSSPKSTLEKAKDAINRAQKAESELMDVCLEMGRDVTETGEKFRMEQEDADQRIRKSSNERGKNLRNIFWVAIAGLLLIGMATLINRRIRAIK